MGAFEKKERQPSQREGWQESLLYYVHDLLIMLTVVLLLFLLVFREITVFGGSMRMTLLDGDYLLLASSTFCREPKYGDIVVVCKQSFENGKPIVKRVIATEGQIVDIDFEAGIVYVDGEALEEDYVNTPTFLDEGMFFPMVVQEGCVFVMGDNRNHSKDSRNPEIGQVDCREILGRAILLLFPGTDEGTTPRDFGRIGLLGL